jgi:pSer/pThr/pTyr-binding forkhead associated (FHA) protein
LASEIMADSRLNSIHLDAQRRQEFRTARDGLLNARGSHTMTVERGGGNVNSVDAFNTAIQKLGNAAPAGVKFVLMDKDYIYPLKVGLNTIGRMPDNDIVLEDAFVSRRHCAILVHAGNGCELHDVASKNGTLLNGHKINGPQRLNSGDEITMCNRQLIFLTKNESREGPAYQVTRAE